MVTFSRNSQKAALFSLAMLQGTLEFNPPWWLPTLLLFGNFKVNSRLEVSLLLKYPCQMNLPNPAMSPVQPKTLIGMLSNKCLVTAAGEEFMVWVFSQDWECRARKIWNAIIGIMGIDKVLEKEGKKGRKAENLIDSANWKPSSGSWVSYWQKRQAAKPKGKGFV